MEKKHFFKKLMEDQDSLREKLSDYFMNNPQTIAELARDIDINKITLQKFLVEEKNVQIKTLMQIRKYLSERK